MDLKIIWAPKAANCLEEIHTYIAKDSPIYACSLCTKILAIVKELSKYPKSGRIVAEYRDANLRERIYNNYRIVYRIKRNAIEVTAICHSARNVQDYSRNF